MATNQVDVKAVITADDRASKVVSDFSNNVQRQSAAASDAFNGIADSIGGVLRKGALLLAAGSFGIGAAAKASWDQVSAVQQATVALNAYEKDTGKVNAALKDLVAYAQSDLGVLFNRKDLFASAQSLEVMGDKTQNLAAHVQILSRSVGLGLSNWEDLNLIVGRVGSTGRLTGDDFDNLTKAGYRLDSGLRNTNITYDQLFAALDKGIPTDALAGQAGTIQGIGIRLQTAFRGIGNAILGVDSSTNQFVKGGLGDTLVNMLRSLTDLLKSPVIKQGFQDIGTQIGALATAAIPVLIDGLKWLLTHMPLVEAVVGSLTTAFIVAKGVAAGFAIAAAINPWMLVATAITAVVGIIAYLQIKFDYVGKALDIMRPSLDLLSDTLKRVAEHFHAVSDSTSINWGQEAVKFIRNSLIELNDAILKIPDAVKTLIAMMETLYHKFMDLTPVIVIIQYLQQVFVPALLAIGAAIWQNLLPALEQFFDSIKRLWNALNPALMTAIKIIVGLLGVELMATLWLVLSGWNIFIQVLSFVISVISNVIDWVSNLISWFGNLVGVVWNTIGTVITIFSNLTPAIKDVIGGVVSLFGQIGGMILGAIGDFGSLLYDAGRHLIQGLINGIEDKVGDIGKAVSGVADKIGSSVKGALHTLHVPGFASGGYTGSGGINDIAGVVHKGEYVLPQTAVDQATGMPKIMANTGGGGNTTINITVQAGAFMGSQVDARKYASEILKSLQEIAASRNTTVANLIGV